jgi:hypothetical protein
VHGNLRPLDDNNIPLANLNLLRLTTLTVSYESNGPEVRVREEDRQDTLLPINIRGASRIKQYGIVKWNLLNRKFDWSYDSPYPETQRALWNPIDSRASWTLEGLMNFEMKMDCIQ